MARLVYGGGRQFNTVPELKAVLIDIWENFSQPYIQKLFDSMNNRVFEVIRVNGQKTKYWFPLILKIYVYVYNQT